MSFRHNHNRASDGGESSGFEVPRNNFIRSVNEFIGRVAVAQEQGEFVNFSGNIRLQIQKVPRLYDVGVNDSNNYLDFISNQNVGLSLVKSDSSDARVFEMLDDYESAKKLIFTRIIGSDPEIPRRNTRSRLYLGPEYSERIAGYILRSEVSKHEEPILKNTFSCVVFGNGEIEDIAAKKKHNIKISDHLQAASAMVSNVRSVLFGVE